MNYRKLCSHLIRLLIGVFVFQGCSAFAPSENISTGLSILIDSDMPASKTYLPNFTPKPDFQKYIIYLTNSGSTTPDYTFTSTGINRKNPQFTTLPYGKYSISVYGYLSADNAISEYAAAGSLTNFTYASSSQVAMVYLDPVSNDGTGTVKYKLTDLSGITSYPVLIFYSNLEDYPFDNPDIIESRDESELIKYTLTADGGYHEAALPSGYYVLIFRNNVFSAVHIYKNFETLIEADITTTDKAATPAVSPAINELLYGTAITLTSSTTGATIYYTTDGSSPTTSSSLYSGPIIITSSVTIKAIAVKAGIHNSDEMTKVFTVKTATPTASLAGGSIVTFGTPVTLSCATSGAAIYYSLDGSTPTASSSQYTGPISITSPLTINAVASKAGITDSEIFTASYSLVQRTVKFNMNYPDNSAPENVVYINDGSSAGQLMAPTFTGYTFIEWNTKADGTGTVFDTNSIVTADITVYAQWIVNP